MTTMATLRLRAVHSISFPAGDEVVYLQPDEEAEFEGPAVEITELREKLSHALLLGTLVITRQRYRQE